MRADRLVAALLVLQSRGRVTAAELAGELEVSVTTARRDLEALSAAGIPVYAQSGRGGGWSLLGGARTDLSGLTSSEAQALFLLVGPAAAVSPDARAALRKLVRALPDTFRTEAEAAADAVVIDPTRWGAPDPARTRLVEALQSAIVRRRRVEVDYVNRTGHRARRTVDPLGLVDKDGVWYLLAGTADGQRTFRVDRIRDTIVTDARAERPADFDLARSWGSVVEEMERRRSLVSATVLIDTRFVRILRDLFGLHCEVIGLLDDGRTRVRLAAPMALTIAEQLAGWGATVEVVEPEEVRSELSRIGSELVQQYRR